MSKLADRAEMNVQTLRNKLNPEQPHQLTDLIKDSTLLDGFLAQIHCLPCVPLNEVASEKMPHYMLNATADIGRIAASAVSGEPDHRHSPAGYRQHQLCYGRDCLLAAYAGANTEGNHKR